MRRVIAEVEDLRAAGATVGHVVERKQMELGVVLQDRPLNQRGLDERGVVLVSLLTSGSQLALPPGTRPGSASPAPSVAPGYCNPRSTPPAAGAPTQHPAGPPLPRNPASTSSPAPRPCRCSAGYTRAS